MKLQARLRQLAESANLSSLFEIKRGIEKESLRVNSSGGLAQTPHPKILGSALTHSSITTDYSEALLEFITAPHTSVQAVLDELEDIHRYTYQHIGDELLWVSSMPCQLGSDESIPVARYGSSNVGQMKTVYRIGLGHRYGRLMQTIAGIHYNFSVSDALWDWLRVRDASELSPRDYKTSGYFSLIRNFRRNFWLLLYLFGAAPAVCKSFVRGRDHQLVSVGDDIHSLHRPYATSLRMGDLGYQSTAQNSLIVCYNGLNDYTDTLLEALVKPYPPYEKIGLRDDNGNYKQLNTHLLQIENEFYSPIRPKRTAKSGQAPVRALQEAGVEYIEVRCIDLNPLLPCGIDAETINFLDCFLLYCLLEESPRNSNDECLQIMENQRRTVYNGRDPDVTLRRHGEEVTLRGWANSLIQALSGVAELLDVANDCSVHGEALRTMASRVEDDSLTPSAQVLAEMRETGKTYYEFAMQSAQAHREFFISASPAEDKNARFEELARASLERQAQIEAADTLSFDAYLENYYRQYAAIETAP